MGLFSKQYPCLICGQKFNSKDYLKQHVTTSHSEFDSETFEKPCKNCKDGIMNVIPGNKSDLPGHMNHFTLVLCQKCGICEFYKNEGHFLDD